MNFRLSKLLVLFLSFFINFNSQGCFNKNNKSKSNKQAKIRVVLASAVGTVGSLLLPKALKKKKERSKQNSRRNRVHSVESLEMNFSKISLNSNTNIKLNEETEFFLRNVLSFNSEYESYKSYSEEENTNNEIFSEIEINLEYFFNELRNPRLNFDRIKYFVENGVDVHAKDKSLNTPLHYICHSNSIHHKKIAAIDLINSLLNKGVDINAKNQNGSTALHELCKNSSINVEMVRFLLENGADTTARDIHNHAPIYELCRFNKNVTAEVVECFLKNGGYVYKSRLLLDLISHELQKNFGLLIDSLPYVEDDLESLFDSSLCIDTELNLIDGTIPIHKVWIETRLEKPLKEIQKTLDQIPREKVGKFLRWVYSGKLPESETDQTDITQIASLFDLDLQKKSRFVGIYKDLARLYEDEEEKDFIIIIGDDEIKVHKFVLQAFSGLYGSFFENVDPVATQISDVSGKSLDAIKIWVKFLYTGEIENSVDREIVAELSDAIDYYQMNDNSLLIYYLDKFMV